jgi:hypothetical protein
MAHAFPILVYVELPFAPAASSTLPTAHGPPWLQPASIGILRSNAGYLGKDDKEMEQEQTEEAQSVASQGH